MHDRINVRYTITFKSVSSNVSFYTNNPKMPNFELWLSCRKWAIKHIVTRKPVFIKLILENCQAEIWGSYIGGDEDSGLLRYDTMDCISTMFRWILCTQRFLCSWPWKQQAPPKHRSLYTNLQSVISQKTYTLIICRVVLILAKIGQTQRTIRLKRSTWLRFSARLQVQHIPLPIIPYTKRRKVLFAFRLHWK